MWENNLGQESAGVKALRTKKWAVPWQQELGHKQRTRKQHLKESQSLSVAERNGANTEHKKHKTGFGNVVGVTETHLNREK